MPKPLPAYDEFDPDSLRPFSCIQLVALDLDGTLLEHNESELPRKVLELAGRLKHHTINVRLTVATGRTFAGSRQLLDRLPIRNDTPIILYNGSLVISRKYSILRQDVIPTESVERIAKLASKFSVKILAYRCDWFGNVEPKEYALGWSSLDRPNSDYNKMRIRWLDRDKFESPVASSAMVIHTAGKAETILGISSELEKIDGISYTRGGTYIEVRPKKSNKGVALEFVANTLKLSRDQVIAVGDNDNDAEMLSWAGIGVAVVSASNLAKNSSNYIANRGVIDGAIELLGIVHKARRLYSK